MTSDCDTVPGGRANQEMTFSLWPPEISGPLLAFEQPSHGTTLAASNLSLQWLNGDSPVPLGWKPPATARHVGYMRSPTARRHGAGETKALAHSVAVNHTIVSRSRSACPISTGTDFVNICLSASRKRATFLFYRGRDGRILLNSQPAQIVLCFKHGGILS